jgi:hypothetical protein
MPSNHQRQTAFDPPTKLPRELLIAASAAFDNLTPPTVPPPPPATPRTADPGIEPVPVTTSNIVVRRTDDPPPPPEVNFAIGPERGESTEPRVHASLDTDPMRLACPDVRAYSGKLGGEPDAVGERRLCARVPVLVLVLVEEEEEEDVEGFPEKLEVLATDARRECRSAERTILASAASRV